jgi:hypothetical protein
MAVVTRLVVTHCCPSGVPQNLALQVWPPARNWPCACAFNWAKIFGTSWPPNLTILSYVPNDGDWESIGNLPLDLAACPVSTTDFVLKCITPSVVTPVFELDTYCVTKTQTCIYASYFGPGIPDTVVQCSSGPGGAVFSITGPLNVPPCCCGGLNNQKATVDIYPASAIPTGGGGT